ncbi:MAG: hypothetical protein RQ760_01840 [Sedimentisphaerales bacterium]|nr:hypothetical protein [Sedimentisphaerales bacterium]
MHPVAALQNDIADFAVVDALGKLLECPAVTGHQSHAHFEVLCRCLLGKLEHPPAGRAVHGDRLFHENIDAFFDCIGEMHPAECRWGCKDSYIPRTQTINRLLISVEADEPATPWNIHLIGVPSIQIFVTAVKAMFEHIAHGDELDRTSFYGQSVVRCAGAPAAAAYQGHLDSVALTGVHTRRRRCHKCRCSGDPSGVLKEVTTGRGFVSVVTHNGFPPN